MSENCSKPSLTDGQFSDAMQIAQPGAENPATEGAWGAWGSWARYTLLA